MYHREGFSDGLANHILVTDWPQETARALESANNILKIHKDDEACELIEDQYTDTLTLLAQACDFRVTFGKWPDWTDLDREFERMEDDLD